MEHDPHVLKLTENLSISSDYDDDPKVAHPVFLFIPDPTMPEHYHIEITDDVAIKLQHWLDIYTRSKMML